MPRRDRLACGCKYRKKNGRKKWSYCHQHAPEPQDQVWANWTSMVDEGASDIPSNRYAIIWPRQYGKTQWLERRDAALHRIVTEDRELLDRLAAHDALREALQRSLDRRG